MSEGEFIKTYGEAPWIFVNKVLEISNLEFRINQPDMYEDRPYEPILNDQVRGTEVKFADLSSGEKILMSLALCLYYAEDHRQLVDYPKVIVFDEIDAPLHPSMTKTLLHTIQEALIVRHGIKIIMTTHSPSTVALAPENSLYTMYKFAEKRLQKSTKDKALAILTSGVPTLSIDYENRRQVFVESQYDVRFYEQIYDKVRNNLIPEISLNFISSGVAGKGNCAQVREVVSQLHKSGSRTVYGIIDWDLCNGESERVKVLGHESRYSIENYILDPLLLATFLLREKLIDRASLGLKAGDTYICISSLKDIDLQRIADFVINRVAPYISPAMSDTRQCEYMSGQVIKLPIWFLQTQGHQLEKAVKEAFHELKQFQKEAQLKQQILLKVVDDIAVFIIMRYI